MHTDSATRFANLFGFHTQIYVICSVCDSFPVRSASAYRRFHCNRAPSAVVSEFRFSRQKLGCVVLTMHQNVCPMAFGRSTLTWATNAITSHWHDPLQELLIIGPNRNTNRAIAVYFSCLSDKPPKPKSGLCGLGGFRKGRPKVQSRVHSWALPHEIRYELGHFTRTSDEAQSYKLIWESRH